MHAGHSTTLFYLSRSPNEELSLLTSVPSCVLPLSGTWFGTHMIRLNSAIVKALTAETTPSTIFHIHHGRDTVLESLTRQLRKRRIAYVMTIHGRYSHIFDLENRVKKPLPALYLLACERQVLQSALFVQAITPDEERIIRRIAPRAVCALLPNAAYSRRVNGVPQPLLHKIPSSQFPIFGFCGRYAIEHKGLDLLLQGFAEYRRDGGRGRLELIGAGSARDQLIAMAKSLQIANVCCVGGPHFGEDKKQILLGWDYFVVPSRYDVLPTASLEAALLGLPLIVSRMTGYTENISKFRSGFMIEELSPRAVANALLLAEKARAAEWSRISAAAFQMAVSIGDWTDIAARLATLYRQPPSIDRSSSE